MAAGEAKKVELEAATKDIAEEKAIVPVADDSKAIVAVAKGTFVVGVYLFVARAPG
jgi:hypothetical protein